MVISDKYLTPPRNVVVVVDKIVVDGEFKREIEFGGIFNLNCFSNPFLPTFHNQMILSGQKYMHKSVEYFMLRNWLADGLLLSMGIVIKSS